MEICKILIDKIEQLCQINNIKINQLLSKCGLSKDVVNNMKKEKPSIPSVDKIQTIAEFFNVSVDYLLGLDTVQNRKSQSSELSEDKRRLFEMYDLLTEREKGEILGELKALTKGKFIAVPIAARHNYSEISVENINHDEIEDFKNAKAQKY